MARYEDYVKNRDGIVRTEETELNLEKEIAASQESSAARRGNDEFTMPARFANKSPEDIAQSYMELERHNSQQGNDLGQMRRTVDQLIALQSQPTEPAIPLEPITSDDLYLDPQAAVSRVATEVMTPQLSKLEAEVETLKARIVQSDITSKHPNWREDTAQPEFKDWVQEKPYRRRLAIAASQSDGEAIDELLEMYGDSQDYAKKDETVSRRQTLSDASLERGASTAPFNQTGGDLFSRQEMLTKRIAAKRGDDEAERWLKVNDDAIRLAYVENRVVD